MHDVVGVKDVDGVEDGVRVGPDQCLAESLLAQVLQCALLTQLREDQ